MKLENNNAKSIIAKSLVLIGAFAAILPLNAHAQAGAPVDGRALYMRTCSACHKPTGVGTPPALPSLVNGPVATAANPNGAILQVLWGKRAMPAQGAIYNDAQIAAILTYVRSNFGNRASAVTPAQVTRLRAAGRPKAK